MKERRWLELACVICIAGITTLMIVGAIMKLSEYAEAAVLQQNSRYQQYMDILDDTVPANAPQN